MPSLPILTFHALAPSRHVVAWPTEAFDAMVTRLALLGRIPQGIDAVLACRTGTLAQKGAYVVTFDDGYSSVISAHAACRRAGGRLVLFLSTSLPGCDPIFPNDDACPRQRALTWPELRELVHDGAEVASHGHRHIDLRALSDAEIEVELASAKELLRDQLGVTPRAFAYPFGAVDARVRARIADHHELAFGTRLGSMRADADPLDLPRLEAHYFRHLATRGDLDGLIADAYVSVRRVLRGLRRSVHS